MTEEKPIPKLLLRPIMIGTNRAMNESEFQAITRDLLKAREKWLIQGAIVFGLSLLLIC